MMNKTLFATALLSAALLATSCQKEDSMKNVSYGPITISAVTEGIDNSATKARTAYKYDVLWGAGDQIIVKGQSGRDSFTLTDGAETTAGTFKQDHDIALSGEVEGFYPASIISWESLVWPAVQDNAQVPPMYSKKSITGKTENFSFKSLGAMLQIVLSTTDSDITLSSIRISDASKPLSGTFFVSDGKAVMTGSGNDNVVLNTGDVPIGNAAKYFNIAVPAGKYDNLKLTFFTNDGKGVAMHSTTMPEIQHNTVAKISLCAKNFGPLPTGLALDLSTLSLAVGGHYKLQPAFTPSDTYNKKIIWTSSKPGVATVDANGMVKAIAAGNTTISAQLEDETITASCDVSVATPVTPPADVLSGHFSVGSNKIISFAKSNLCKKSDGTFTFLENQYDIAQNIAQGGNINDFVTWNQLTNWLKSSDGQHYQTLSADEWKYLFGDNEFRKGLYAKHVTVVGVEDCLIIYPDGYTGTKVTDKNRYTLYNDSEAWARAQNDGVVCLTPVKADGFAICYWITADYVIRIYGFDPSTDLSFWWSSGPERDNAARPVYEVK